jgi:hypothetical protein
MTAADFGKVILTCTQRLRKLNGDPGTTRLVGVESVQGRKRKLLIAKWSPMQVVIAPYDWPASATTSVLANVLGVIGLMADVPPDPERGAAVTSLCDGMAGQVHDRRERRGCACSTARLPR